MKICVVGLGAVGGLIAHRLTSAGEAVSGVARGEALAAIRARGLRLQTGSDESAVALPVADDPQTLGVQDLVVIALKSPALLAFAPRLAPLIGTHTVLLPAMNGVPWWFLQTSSPKQQLVSVDPRGQIESVLPLGQVLGCVVHLASSAPAPGVVRHAFGDKLIVGEPAGGTTSRARDIAALLAAAGFAAIVSDDIRREIWFKLWGNMTMNPVSALTGATADRIIDDPLVAAFMLRAMAEAAEVGARIGCPIDQSGEARIGVTRQLGAFKTSMLQDAEAGRPLELDALVTVVHEIALGLGIATPNIDALLGLTRLMGRSRNLY